MKLQRAMLALACAASLGAGPVMAQATFAELSGQEILYAHEEGTVNCRGGAQPTGEFFQPCGVGVPGQIRGRRILAYEVTGSPLFNGNATIIANVNFDAQGEGPMWGTVSMTLFAGGVIEGMFSGKADVTSVTVDLRGVGRGFGGTADGLHFMFEAQHDGSPFGELTVRVLDPGG